MRKTQAVLRISGAAGGLPNFKYHDHLENVLIDVEPRHWPTPRQNLPAFLLGLPCVIIIVIITTTNVEQ